MRSVYSGFYLCPSLTTKEKCIRLREYKQGSFHERLHQHVPAHQLSPSAATELLRALVLRYEEASAQQIIDAYLTRRGGAAKFAHPPNFAMEYPEPGVQRNYCGGNVIASVDTVLSPKEFRPAKNQTATKALRAGSE